MKKILGVLLSVAVISLASCALNEDFNPVNDSIVTADDNELLANARADLSDLFSIIDNIDNSEQSSGSSGKTSLPAHNARLFDHQAVIIPFPNNIPGGSSVITSVYQRDGIDFLWVSEVAPVGIFNWSVLNREFGDMADSDDHVWGYYYLTVKPDFYQNKVTAVEITADEYYRIIAAYAAQ